MKTMKHTGKKALSVFLAVLMVMTAWVFVAPTEVEASGDLNATQLQSANLAILNTLTKPAEVTLTGYLSTKVGRYNFYSTGDPDSMVNQYGTQSFKNVVYTPQVNSASDPAADFGMGQSQRADSVKVFYPDTVMVVDGKQTPQMGVLLAADAYSGQSLRCISCWMSSGSDGLTFMSKNNRSEWHGKAEEDSCFYYTLWEAPNGYCVSSNGQNTSTKWGTTNGKWTFFANHLRFTGSFNANEWVRRIVPTWSFMGGSNDSSVYTATSRKTIYVVNLKGYNDKIASIFNDLAWVKQNASQYKTESVQAYVNAIKGVINASPANYNFNSFGGNEATNWETAIKNAISTYDSALANAKKATYTLTFKDIDGNVKYTQTYDYGTAVNCTNIAAGLDNTIKQYNEQYHQTYTWDTSKFVTTITDDVEIGETPSGTDAHAYGSYTQDDTTHSRTCSVCSYVHTQSHIKGTGYVTKAETCTEDGVMTYDCSTCGKKAIETSVINNITGHDFNGTPIENVTGENGNHWKKCSRCDAYGWAGVENDCENHNWDKNADGKVDAGDAETKASTCKEAGYEKYTCKVCNATWTKTLSFAEHKITATAKKDVTNQCGGDGNEAFWTCSVCNRVWKDAALKEEVTDLTDADGDNIPDVLETKGPNHDFTGACVNVSNGADGTHYRQCKRFTQCGKYGLMVDGVAVEGATEAHKFTSTETASSCTVQGTKTYTCSDCNHSYTEKLPLVAHSMTKIEAVAAECNKPGNNEYYSCSTCSRYYKDANGTTVTTVEAEKIAALEHKWTAHHDYDTLKTAADCMNPAVYNNHCDYCKTQIIGKNHEYGLPDTLNGHKFNGDIVDLKNGKHAYKCTVEGCKEYGNSTDCNYQVTDDVASTCKTLGYTTYECETCGNCKTDIKALDPTNHTGEGTKIVGALDAKCNSDGYTGDTHCLGCDAQLEKGEKIVADKTVHPHENMKDYEAKASTCQVEGWKAYRYCDQCRTYEIPKVTVPVKAHLFTKYTTNNDGTHTAICDTCKPDVATPATDTKDCSGGTATCVDQKVCTVCNTAYGEVDSANHKTVVRKAKVPATCQTEGTEAYRYCEACKTALEEIGKIEKLAHKYGAWSQIAGEDKHTRSCTTCNPAVAAVATETADCYGGTANCVDKAKCTACKAEYGTTNPAVHKTTANHLVNKKDATCQAPGYTGDYLYDCCDALKEAGEATPKLDHSFTIEVSRNPATCIAEGSVKYKCSTCVETDDVKAETTIKTLSIDPKNHASTETKTVGAYPATCKDNGFTGNVYYVCCYNEAEGADNSKALKEKGTVIKADGNSHTDLENVAAVPATCQKAGNKAYSHCLTCGTYLINGEKVTQDQTREAKKDHKFTTYETNRDGTHTATCETCDANVATPATDTKKCSGGTANCTELAECSVCNGTYGKVDATTHKTVKNFEKVDSTCQTEGYEAYQYCEACGKDITEKKTISKKAHKFGEWTPVDDEDKHIRSCTTCNSAVGTVATETEACKGGTATCKNEAECSVCAQKYGAINPNNHISDKVVTEERVEATCQMDGWTGREYYECCYVAGEDNTAALKNPGTKLPKVAHKYVEVSRKPATCLTKGSVSYKCSTCKEGEGLTVATKTEELKIDKNNHASDVIITKNAVKATCSKDGYSGDKYHDCCDDINKTTSLIQKGYKIPATGDHKLINPVPEYLVEYTKTDGVITGYTKKADTLSYEEKIKFRHEDDKWYHVQICADCGKIVESACFTYEHTSTCTTTDSCEICEGLCSLVNPKNHGGNLILIPAVPATGSTPGTIAHYMCNACGKLFFDEAGQEQVVKPEDLEIEVTIEHEIKEGVPAVPGENGTHKYECEHCEEFIVEDCSGGTATCQSKAECSICGQEYGEIDAKNHITDEVVIVGKKDATCSDSGYTGDAYYKCCYVEGADDNSKALKAEGKVIPNDPSLHVMKLRDNLDGTHTEYCEGCGTYELPAVAHIWVAGKVPETASCTEGYDLGYTCICGATKTEHVDAKGHDYAETVKENPADCTTEGEKIITKTCKVCGATETVTETIAALGHDKRTIKGVPATCSTNGSTDYIYCNRCDTVLQDTTVIPATGCEDKNNDGFCDSCGDYLRINEDGTNCNCICHKKNVFMKLLYKFLNFFWKLFKIEKTCGCGAVQHW